ncbi:hypothetical protein [Streptomyces sp. MW-W600-10]|uniref:hypothetical protein n=1 Tax=Streptomyces sp. MW-W600-10 TaxID=2829819 RepID=UPI001C465CEC|nr:hypothetical protein [Streptomyces sp. MW-W600-10]MBV7244143.1 hypothetical protein [Streptomyces sp. MW-W600-10]
MPFQGDDAVSQGLFKHVGQSRRDPPNFPEGDPGLRVDLVMNIDVTVVVAADKGPVAGVDLDVALFWKRRVVGGHRPSRVLMLMSP